VTRYLWGVSWAQTILWAVYDVMASASMALLS
jgi:hypothetical protein